MASLLEKLSAHTGMSGPELRRLMVSAPNRYKHYTIPKRSGGLRRIAQPAREIKIIQRALVDVFLKHLPVHHCASAYREGLSILDNAVAHADNGPILKLDLKDFFPSLKPHDWLQYCKRTECLIDLEEIHLTSRLLFHRAPGDRYLRLAIGAPSSPTVSNVLMFDTDVRIFESVAEDFVTYTRYADDMTFSALRTGFMKGVMSKVAKVLRETSSPNLSLNPDKTVYVTTKYRRTVTGLTLANDGRVTIGRERKRAISAGVHRASLNQLGSTELQLLAGMLAYVNAVEPAFIDVLRKKYGARVISQIQVHVVKRKLAPHDPPLAQK